MQPKKRLLMSHDDTNEDDDDDECQYQEMLEYRKERILFRVFLVVWIPFVLSMAFAFMWTESHKVRPISIVNLSAVHLLAGTFTFTGLHQLCIQAIRCCPMFHIHKCGFIKYQTLSVYVLLIMIVFKYNQLIESGTNYMKTFTWPYLTGLVCQAWAWHYSSVSSRLERNIIACSFCVILWCFSFLESNALVQATTEAVVLFFY